MNVPPLRARRASLVLLLTLLCAVPAARAQTAPPPDFDRYVASVLDAFDVPGMAVAIVKDGEVVLERGFGVRDMERPTPVDAHTLFGIASNTKAFTATALAMLVEDGRLAWDEPVVRYMPDFALSDPYVTAHLTVRDLLAHRSGLSLGAGDLLWWPANTLPASVTVEHLRRVPLATSFRSTYAYDNMLFVTAGQLVERVSGQTWEAFVRARILTPLGMTETVVSPPEGLARPNVARPHAPVDGVVRPVPAFDGTNGNAAAGIMSNAHDITRWLQVQLDSGRVAPDRRLFEAATTNELWGLVMPIPIPPGEPELAALRPQFSGYALGFFVRDYRGVKTVQHTGGLPGFLSQVMLVPGLDLGIAVFTNQESAPAFRAVTQYVVDHYMGAPRTDWIAAYEAVTARQHARVEEAERATAAARDASAGPSLPLASYAGRYEDPWYGEVSIVQEGGGLVMRFAHTPELVGDLEHWQHDTFLVRWHDRATRADAFVTFALRPDGTIAEARMEPASPAVDFSFDFQDLVLRPVEGATP
ncbi:MAG TPA: serine hydrolase [Rhodothermales bacterium]|nr:serine hydrolase [Rhodothermales bacterium]